MSMKLLKYILIGITLITLSGIQNTAFSQNESASEHIAKESGSDMSVEMADTFREEGKIYVVVAVSTTVMIGLLVYLFMLDRKVKTLRRMLEETENS